MSKKVPAVNDGTEKIASLSKKLEEITTIRNQELSELDFCRNQIIELKDEIAKKEEIFNKNMEYKDKEIM